ncbi:hypothetical protein [Xylanivirga thermophila]|uniref:hypothetical protein n=1 Tax=Xylanivirga thermophila TaxID=2496273 RepID=UPI00101BB774|nr:hypothetical protein [Xylanivirga thermophila]
MRKELFIGIFAQAIYIVLSRFFNAPELFLGFLQGLAVCFIIIGILPRESYSKLKEWKRAIRLDN